MSVELIKKANELESAVSEFLDADKAWNNDEISEKDYCSTINDLKTAMYSYREERKI